MITNLRLSGFKCIKDNQFPLSRFNILCGPNASGKSTVLQFLLLLRQSLENGSKITRLNLQGELYEGGIATDILHPESSHAISCEIVSDIKQYSYNFRYDRETDTSGSSRSLRSTNMEQASLPPELAGPDFIYLNAERASPKVSFQLPADRPTLAGVLGKHGEFTTAILAKAASGQFIQEWTDHPGFRDSLIRAPKDLDDIELNEEITLSQGRIDLVVNQLLRWIIPGASFTATENSVTDAAILRYSRDVNRTRAQVRPTHIGFGLTYALPILTAGLIIPPGGIIIIENPEAHLHPFSQSRLGVYLALVAASGRQLIIETHSDHFINGFRVALKRGYLTPQQASITFFKPPKNGSTALPIAIQCERNGRLSKWPAGFFDQIEDDLSRL